MTIKLPPLPYASDALAPAISARTLDHHHGKHHRAYVDKVNAAIAKSPLADSSLEAVIVGSREADPVLFNNAAQSWNHGFYWHSLSPQSGKPVGELAHKIDAAFGSLAGLSTLLKQRGADHFASGWLWLAEIGGRLSIEETHDGDTLADSDFNPLLTIDLWEHAYYLDHQNARADYLMAVVERNLNWTFAANNLARGSVWTYPA